MTKTQLFKTTLFVAIFLLLAGSAYALNLGGDSGTLNWSIDQPNDGLKLSVTGPDGFVWEREYDAGAAPTFSIFDKNGYTFADGQYSWEIVLYPVIDAPTRKAMLAAREAGDIASMAQIEKSFGQTTFSGSFRIQGGDVTLPTAMQESLEKDVVHLDDTIITGSLCVGFDCVNGENFGFDTLRLKENNLRINFHDTSSSGSFPSNDWRIVANDSTNGGGNYLAIEDAETSRLVARVDAGAPTDSLRIDSGGDLGLGTSNPVVDIHAVNGNTPTLRLEQNGSSGFTPQTYDIASNEANFFIRDVTNGSKLFFRAKPGAPESSLTVAANGDIGMGTFSPSASLHVTSSDVTTAALVEDTSSDTTFLSMFTLSRPNSSGGIAFRFANSTDTIDFNNTSGEFRINFADGDAQEFSLDPDGNLTVDGTVSANNGGATLPDYVFEDDYELMPLSELAAFVKTEKHLPNIPSKADVAAAGGVVNMSDMQYKLLEKVEELTLYTLDQQSTIEELRKEIEALKSQR